MRRGDLVTVAIAGDFGKPRPALVIQSDRFAATGTVTVLLVTSTCIKAPLIRIDIAPAQENGLRKQSQIAVDKAMSVKRERVSEPFGHLDQDTMTVVNRSLALFLGFA
jgi:mRNA interferase MazF